MTLWHGTVGGIGDIIYLISGGTSIDRFLLMQPWGESPPQKGGLNSDGTLTSTDVRIVFRTRGKRRLENSDSDSKKALSYVD